MRDVLVLRAQQSLALYLDRWRRAIARHLGLAEFLSAWASNSVDPASAWDLTHGRIFRALHSDDRQLAESAGIALAVHLMAHGASGDWRTETVESAQHVFGGWLLPAADNIRAEADADRVTFSLESANQHVEVVFTRKRGDWICQGPAMQIPRVGRGSIRLRSRAALRHDEFPDVAADGEYSVSGVEVDALKTTLATLRQHSPPYARWVHGVLRDLAVFPGTVERLRSGTASNQFGLSYVSTCDNAVALSESLVHESSHHYYHIARWLGPVQDGSDERLYYSPAVQRERPLDRILLAYHAFANVILMYRDYRAAGYDVDDYARVNERALLGDVKTLDAPLRDNPALTVVGRGLYEPLRKRLW
jgi:HEXXH motif-containing protein